MQYQDQNQEPDRGNLATHFEWFEPEPPKEVWEKLEMRLDTEEKWNGRKRFIYAMAASLVLLAALSFIFFQIEEGTQAPVQEYAELTESIENSSTPETIATPKPENAIVAEVLEEVKEVPPTQVEHTVVAIVEEEEPFEQVDELIASIDEIVKVEEIIPEENITREPTEEPLMLSPITETPVVRVTDKLTDRQPEEVDIKATPTKPKKELRIKLGPLQITHKNYRQKTNTSRS
ncbi:MAG: hypothetical protein AAGC85_04135 [Bacteroidota bacterium]